MEEVDLNKFLEKYRDTKVDFYRFPGNYGDSLIWHGTKILLNKLNISENYVEIDSPKINNLNDLSGDITVFCREKVSYNFVKRNFLKGNVYLWHDCAFYNIFKQIPDGLGILNTFREDKESIIDNVPEDNNDLSYS